MEFAGERQTDYTQGINGFDNPNLGAQKSVDTAVSHAIHGLPSVAAGLVEVIAKSVWALDEDSDAIPNLLTNMNEDLGTYYKTNREAAQTAGSVAATFTPGGVITQGTKLVTKGAWAWRQAQKTSAGRKISPYLFTSGNTLRTRQEKAALFAERAFTQGKRSIRGDKDLADLLTTARVEGAADIAKETIAAEALMYLTLSESDLFFPDGEYTMNNAMFNAAIVGAFGVVGGAANNYTIIKTVDAVFSEAARKATESGGLSAEKILQATSDKISKGGMGFSIRTAAAREIDDILDVGEIDGVRLDDAAIKIQRKKKAVYVGEANQALKALGVKSEDGLTQAKLLDENYKGLLTNVDSLTEVTPRALDTESTGQGKNYTETRAGAKSKFIIAQNGTMLNVGDYKVLGALENKKDLRVKSGVAPLMHPKDAARVVYNSGKGKQVVSVTKKGEIQTSTKAGGIAYDGEGADYLAADAYIKARLKAFGAEIKSDDIQDLKLSLNHYALIDVALGTKSIKSRLSTQEVNELKFEALSQKYKVFNELIQAKDAKPSQIAQIINIPSTDLGYSSPLLSTFASWSANGVKKLEDHLAKGNIKYLLSAVGSRSGGLTDTGLLQGLTLKRGGLADEVKAPALIAVARELPENKTVDDLATLAAAEQVRSNTFLSENSLVYNALGKFVAGQPELRRMARNVDGIAEDSLIGAGIFGFQKNRSRANSAIQSLGSLTQGSYGELRKVTEIFTADLRKTIEPLARPEFKHVQVEYGLFKNEYKTGWHLSERVKGEGGKSSYSIDPEIAVNQKIFNSLPENTQALLKAKFDEGELELFYLDKARKGEYKPVVISADTSNLIRSMDNTSQRFLKELNAMRVDQGLKEIDTKSLHIPYNSIQDKYVGFLVRADDHPEISFSAKTEVEFKKIKDRLVSENPNLMYFSRDDLKTIKNADDIDWGVVRNFSNPNLQTGTAAGRSGGTVAEVGLRVISDDYAALMDSFSMLSRKAHELMFAPQLNHLRRVEQFTEFGDGAAKLSKGKSEKASLVKNSALQEWRKTLYEQHPDAMAVQKTVASFYDKTVQGISTKLGQLKVSTEPTKDMQASYAAMSKSLGTEFSPFKNINDYMEKTANIKVPPDMAKHATFFNYATYAATIGVLDAGMAVLNYASWVVVQPATIAALRMTAQEKSLGNAGIKSWESRTGLIGSKLGANELNDQLVLANPMKTAASVFAKLNTPDMRDFLKYAGDRGHLDVTLVESLNTFTAPVKGYRAQMLEKGIDGLSFFTRKSEKHSKILGAATNYMIARDVAQMSKNEARAFAIRQMDQVVGNYQAFNKPRMYQGAAGLPLGLFTTWITNYLQRLYGDIEALRGDAVFWQMGLQASLLGGESLPGWELLSNSLMATYNGQENLTARIGSEFGAMGDVILYGAIGNIPKIFGADTGIAIHTRASIGLPGLYSNEFNPADSIPSISVAADLASGALASAKSMVANKGWSTNDQLEILSNYGVHGGIKNLADIVLGYDTNRARELISEDVRDFMPFMARLLELKTIKEVKTADALYAQKTSMMVRRNKMEAINGALRAAIRNDELTGEKLEELMSSAVAAGTPVQGLRNWLTRNIKTATEPKAERAARQYINGYAENEAGARLFEIVIE